MRRFLGVLLGGAILSLPVIAGAGPRHTMLDLFVYDTVTLEPIIGATVTVEYTGGLAVDETDRPHGRARFRLPGGLDSVVVTAEADGYCPDVLPVLLDGRNRSGGNGIFMGLAPCPAGP